MKTASSLVMTKTIWHLVPRDVVTACVSSHYSLIFLHFSCLLAVDGTEGYINSVNLTDIKDV